MTAYLADYDCQDYQIFFPVKNKQEKPEKMNPRKKSNCPFFYLSQFHVNNKFVMLKCIINLYITTHVLSFEKCIESYT